jgi:WD40 repeat protein
MFKRLLWIILLLAACTPGGNESSEAGPTVEPTLAVDLPSAYVEATSPITLENVTETEFLGRLDTNSAPSTIFSHAFSPDSTRLAALNNEQLLAWDLLTGALIFTTARQRAFEVYYSPDKNEIYTVADSGLIRVYETERGALQTDLPGHTRFSNAVAYYEDDGWIALGGQDGSVRVWDTLERLSLVTFDSGEPSVEVVAFSSNGERLAAGSANGFVTIWNWRDRELIARLDHQGGVPVKLAFSPDDQTVAVGTNEQIAVWSLAEGNLNYALQTGEGGVNEVLMFSPDGRYLINAGRMPDATIWDAHTAALAARLPGLGGNRVSMAFSPDGRMLLTSVLDGTVSLWDMTQITAETVSRAELDVGGERTLFVDWTPDSFLWTFFDATGPIFVWGIGEVSSTSE